MSFSGTTVAHVGSLTAGKRLSSLGNSHQQLVSNTTPLLLQKTS